MNSDFTHVLISRAFSRELTPCTPCHSLHHLNKAVGETFLRKMSINCSRQGLFLPCKNFYML